MAWFILTPACETGLVPFAILQLRKLNSKRLSNFFEIQQQMEESDFECELPVKGINQFSTHTALAEPELSSECMCKKSRVADGC